MLACKDGWFKDEHDRVRLLHGVNLSGGSKIPAAPEGATWRREGFFDHRQVSFVGRPFPLEAADEHFRRLRSWGLTFIRFLITWEAVEHAGPGVYDTEYLDYLHAVLQKAGAQGLQVFIDPHQDVWSRFSGGDGAPGWTFEAVGLDMTAFDETGAALTHQVHGDPLPTMIWHTNHARLAAATMFTLFFAGNALAPHTLIEGEPAQEYLQRHYIAAMQAVARRLKGLPHIVGYDTLNEPGRGYIGCADLNHPMGELLLGALPTPFQSMLLGAGIPQQVGWYEPTLGGARVRRLVTVNPRGRSAWMPGHACIWQEHGVWAPDQDGGHLLQPSYFTRLDGHPVDMNRDCLVPFARRYLQAIREIEERKIIFVECAFGGRQPAWAVEDGKNIASAPHWYDPTVLMLKKFSAWLGYDVDAGKPLLTPWIVRRAFARKLLSLRREAFDRMNAAPLLLGEFGIPFDLNGKRAYRRFKRHPRHAFRTHVRALDRSMQALEYALLSWTIWNYSPDNTNARGDQWNGEDFSIWSRDQQADPSDLNSGGRALEAVVRPYPLATAGTPLRMRFNPFTRHFNYTFLGDPAAGQPTEIFLPSYQYRRPPRVRVSDGRFAIDAAAQLLHYYPAHAEGEHTIRIRP